MPSHHIVCFLKFGAEKFIYDLWENGTIYMNPIDNFRKIEDNELRGDSYEGIAEITNIPGGEWENPFLKYKGKFVHLHLRTSYDHILGNIYSLYCISSKGFKSPSDFRIDDKMKGFGSHFLFIKDNIEFIRRIRSSLKDMGIKYFEGFVDYYDKNEIDGQISLFQKPMEFEYQKEFRIYADTKKMEPLIFSIGSLKDISEIVSTELIKEIELVPKVL